MHDVQLQNALKAQQSGQLDEAETLLQKVLASTPNNPHALHIAGFVARDRGDFLQAESNFRASLQDHLNARTKAEFANNLAKLYLSQGLPERALEMANFGKRSDPSFTPIKRLRAKILSHVGLHQDAIMEASSLTLGSVDPANWLALANTYQLALDWPNTRKAAQTLLQLVPDHKAGQHLLAIAAAHLEPIEQAAAYFVPLANDSEALVSLADAYLEAGVLDLAQENLQIALRASPFSLPALTAQAAILWMTGEGDKALHPLKAACDGAPTNQALHVTLARTARQIGAFDMAQAAIGKALAFTPDHPVLLVQQASIFAAQGELDTACNLAQQAMQAWPDSENILREGAHILLQAAQFPAALQACERGIALRPWSYEWIALTAATKKALNIEDHQAWFNFAKFVKTMPIDLPSGYDSLAAFNAELGQWLRQRHTFKAHPLINSVRGGTQISLPTNQGRDPILDAFYVAITGPINRYIAALKDINNHPFAARATKGWRLSGLWSVCLRHGGGHVNHIHPDGWISSAYYVDLPASVSGNDQHAGWIGFGAPRFPAAQMDHDFWVEPKVGNLALFPSYMWHGVKSFSDASERLTLAFDVVPI